MSSSTLVIKVLASELVLCCLSAAVVAGYSGLAGDWPSITSASVVPLVGAWIETIMRLFLIGVPIYI